MTLLRRAHRGAFGRSTVLALAAATALALVLPVAASAGNGATTVRGTQLAFGTCGGDGYRMTGALTGCWWITSFDTGKSDPAKSHYRATGTEHFEGCLNRTICGSFDTTFAFTTKTDGPWADGAAEIHGRCHHPLDRTKGTGDFAGASGEISFHDVVTDPPSYPYWGNVHLATAADAGSTIARLVGAPTAQAIC